MRKLIALFTLLAFVAGNSYAYVPLSSAQNNLGSYQNNATGGMFYNELDILSIYPVELIDFAGNNLYTNWSNARNYAASNATYPTALKWGSNVGNANLSPLLIGVTGDLLGNFGIEGSKVGVVFQNYGGKSTTYNLDGVAGNDSEGKILSETFTAFVATETAKKDVKTENTDVKYWTNTTNTQWNAGIAKKDLIVRGLDLGFGLSRITNSSILTTGGTKTYTDRYLMDQGATDAGMPGSAREGDTVNIAYDDNSVDLASTATTDLKIQGRYPVMDELLVTVGLGARYRTSINPGGLVDITGAAQGTLEKNAITVAAKDDQGYNNAAAVLTQYYDYATSIVNRSKFDYATAPSAANIAAAANGVYNLLAASKATTDFKDTRSGMGPMVDLEGAYKLEKVNVTGVVHYDSVNQPLDASQTSRHYVNTRTVNPAVTTEVRTWTKEYNETITTEGNVTNTNLDLGAKIEFKALENVKLALGGFIQTNTALTDATKMKFNTSTSYVYDDGNAANNAGTVGIGNKPGPVGGDGFGTDVGFGEGSWSQTMEGEIASKTETQTVTYTVPVGVEIPLYKDKWLFRAGTSYSMAKTKTVTKNVTKSARTITSVSPAGAAVVTPSTYADTQPSSNDSVTYAETHTTLYTYGIQWNVSKSLSVAANAVLDTPANVGAATREQTIFDLDTYRSLSLQAVFHF